jgi:hypothetical protein
MFSNFYTDNLKKTNSYQHITNSKNLLKILLNKGFSRIAYYDINIQTGHKNTTTKLNLGGKENENCL